MNKNQKNVPIREDFKEPTEPSFDIDRKLGKISSLLFDIDKYSVMILGVIAKHGPLNQKKISEISFDSKSHNITRDVVRYRLHSSKNSASLTKSNFVIRQTGKRVGNIRSREESTYHLLFKGFLASLSQTRFDQCYIVKNYVKHMPKWTIHYHIPEISLQIIKFDLALFMLKYVMIGSKFNHQVDIDTHRHSLNYDEPLTNPTFTPQTRNIKYELPLMEIRYWHHVYSQVLNRLLEKMKRDRICKEDIKRVVAYINDWHQWFFTAQFGSTPFSPQDIPLRMTSQIMPVGRTVDVRDVNDTAKQILKKFNIHVKLNPDEVPRFFS